MRVKELRLKWELANRSWFVTENMTSATPDTAAWTTFKNVLVNENGEFVVKSTAAWVITEVYRQATAPTSPVTGWLWVDTSSGNGWQVLKQYNGTAWTELDRLSIPTSPIAVDTTLWDAGTLIIIDWNSWLPINVTLPAASTMKWRRIEFYKYRGTSQINLVAPTATLINSYAGSSTTYAFKNINPNYFMTIRSDGWNWIVDDDNIYNRVANTLFVDLTYGNNTFAVREFESRPFSTVAAAVAASLPWDTIVLRSWVYANIWTINLLQDINFYAEDWVTIQAWLITCNDNIKVNFMWHASWIRTWANTLFLVWSNVELNYELKYGQSDWRNFVRNINQPIITNTKVIGSVWNINNTWWFETWYNINNWWLWTVNVTNCYFEINVSNNINYGLFNMTNLSDSNTIVCNFNKSSHETASSAAFKLVQIDAVNSLHVQTNNVIHINWKEHLWLITASAASWVIRIAGQYARWTKLYYNIDRYYGAQSILLEENWFDFEWYFEWQTAISTNRVLFFSQQGNSNHPSAPNKSNTIYNNIIYCKVDSPWVSWWASSSTPWVIFIVWQWSSYICTSKVHESMQYLVWWVDNQAVAWVPNNYTATAVEFYWTRLYSNNQLAWATWLLHNDEWHWANAHPKITYNFYSGCSFTLLWNANQLISWAAWGAWTLSEVNFYDDYTTNIWFSYGASIDKISYLNNHTTTIAAWWTYTVLDSDKDLYYDLATLWNLTLVLPDPAKFVNREINFKVTSTHATNTVTIDPVWAALIEWATTRVVPNTSTARTSETIKSDWTSRRIK